MLVQKAQQTIDSFDSIGTYLRELGRIPLLSPEQEIHLGHQVQQMMSLLEIKQALTLKLQHEPTISEWANHVGISETQLNKTICQGQRAKEKMVSANLRLVVAVAKKYQKRDVEFLDLIQEGSMGLQRGVEKFDPTRGYRFSTYCYWWITQGITRAIAEKSRTIRLPIHINEKLNKIKKAQRQLCQQLGRTPTGAEIASVLKLTPKQVRECLQTTQQPISLDMRVGENQDLELGELLEDTREHPEEFVNQSCLANDLERLIAELTPQQREVLTLRYGLVDGEAKTLAEVGAHLKLSRERVRQVENQALQQLRQHQGIAGKLADY